MTKRKHPNTAAGKAASKNASPWSRGPHCTSRKALALYKAYTHGKPK